MVPTLVLAALSALVILLIVTAVPEEVERDQGLSDQARRVSTLAAERTLTRLDLPARSLDRLDELPPPDHVLVIATPLRERLLTQVDRVFDWVEAGGHLVVEAMPAPWEATGSRMDDPLLAPWDIGTRNFHVRSEPAELSVRTPTEGPFRVWMDGSRCVEDHRTESEWSTAYGLDHDCASALQVLAGRGRITAVGDLGWIHNEELGELDHAAALRALVRSGDPPAGVWLLYQDVPLSLSTWIWTRAWPPLTTGLVLLALWIASRAQRFGPRVVPPGPDRRERLAHVDAVGDFLWRQARQQALVDAVRRVLLRSMRATEPPDSTALAAQAGVSPAQVDEALREPVPHDPQAFTRVIQLLERLRRTR